MNIYFVGAISALDTLRPKYEKIIDTLESEGHRVSANHILGKKDDATRELTEGFEEPVGYFNQVKQQIGSTDMVVAEVSIMTRNIGQEIAYALERSKPVLALHNEEMAKQVKPFLIGNVDDTLIVKSYTGKNLKKVVLDGLVTANKLRDEKAIVPITPMISDYLDWITSQKKVSRSVYLRSLVEEKIRRDTAYKNSKQ